MHRAPVHERECEFMRHHLFLRERRWFVWHGILFEEPNPTGSRPSDLIGLYKQHMQPHPRNVLERPRRDKNEGSDTEVTVTSSFHTSSGFSFF